MSEGGANAWLVVWSPALGEVPFVTSQRALKCRFLPDGAVLLDVPQHGDGGDHRPARVKVTHTRRSVEGAGPEAQPQRPLCGGRDVCNNNETKVEERPAFLTCLVE